jgi:hypothetical protein
MRAIMESSFSIVYLVFAMVYGHRILKNSNKREFMIFGWLTIILGLGDAFHLVPRIWALNTTGTENFQAALGFGTLVTSITMTIFYVLLYHFWELRFHKNNKSLKTVMYGLAVIRIALCLLPQNQWFVASTSNFWGIVRNTPFLIMGLITLICFFQTAKLDKAFRWMWLAILLSFGFYLPVVLWVHTNELFGVLMLPKTVAYMWIIMMGWNALRKN